MQKRGYISRTSLWLARIWGSLVLAFILFFLIAHLLNDSEAINLNIQNIKETITFVCFPILTLIGLLIAYRWEGPGGLISSLSILIAMLLNSSLDLKFFLLIFPPGLLYLIYWYFSRTTRILSNRMKLH